MRQGLANETIEQNNSTWHGERRIRLTASNFGKSIKHRQTSKPSVIVNQLLYKPKFITDHTKYGREEENESIKEYENLKCNEKVSVKKQGLIISQKFSFLAASPDGVVVDTEDEELGLIEINNLSKHRNLTIADALVQAKKTSITSH